MIKFSLLGETILEWNDKDIEHYHARRMAMDSMLCRFKATYPAERIDSVRSLLEDKERQMFQIVRLMDEQQSINKKIANQIPVIVQKSVQEQSKKPKRKGFLGIFGKKKEVTPAVSTTILHSVNRNVISEQKVQDRQLSEQAEHFDNILASGYSAILFNPTDANGSAMNAKSASRAGVPVFCMDREINVPGAAVTQILSDNYSGCITLGQFFVETLDKRGNYVEILGLVGDNNTWARSNGFHSVVDCYEGLKMVAQQNADFDQNKAMEVMESMMQAHPDIDAVFCGNDAMAMGAYQAVLAAGKTNQIKIFGFDGADDCVKAIREGKIAGTGMQFPKTMAVTAANLADKYIKGERNLPKKLPVAVELVNKSNVTHYGHFGRLD